MQLVYEKERRLRMMMKMHGLGDTAYWYVVITGFGCQSCMMQQQQQQQRQLFQDPSLDSGCRHNVTQTEQHCYQPSAEATAQHQGPPQAA